MTTNRVPDLDVVTQPKQPWQFVLFIAQPRGYACLGPGKDKPCPTKWQGTSSSKKKRCDDCKKEFDKLCHNFHKRKRYRLERVRKQLTTNRVV